MVSKRSTANRARSADNRVHERISDIDRVSIENLKWEIRYEYASKHASGRVLDVACGKGHGSQWFKEYIGVDIDADSVEQARKQYEGKTFVVGDALDLPFQDGSFDTVVSLETIEHLSKQKEFLVEIARVLRPGGVLVMSTPRPNRYPNPFHVRELKFGDFTKMLLDRFSVTQAYGYSLPGMVGGYFVYEGMLTLLLWAGVPPRVVKSLLHISKSFPQIALNYLVVARKA